MLTTISINNKLQGGLGLAMLLDLERKDSGMLTVIMDICPVGFPNKSKLSCSSNWLFKRTSVVLQESDVLTQRRESRANDDNWFHWAFGQNNQIQDGMVQLSIILKVSNSELVASALVKVPIWVQIPHWRRKGDNKQELRPSGHCVAQLLFTGWSIAREASWGNQGVMLERQSMLRTYIIFYGLAPKSPL